MSAPVDDFDLDIRLGEPTVDQVDLLRMGSMTSQSPACFGPAACVTEGCSDFPCNTRTC